MYQLIELVGNVIFANPINIDGEVETGKSLVLSGDLLIYHGGSDYPYYTGEYVVIPKSYEQFLDTDNKILTDDVDVKEIPYAEVPNIQGGLTVTIGE